MFGLKRPPASLAVEPGPYWQPPIQRLFESLGVVATAQHHMMLLIRFPLPVRLYRQYKVL
jgi:hypothetical protein